MTGILTTEQLSSLSNEELLELYEEYNSKAIIQKNIEQAIKILINSLYGYLGSPYSRFYNLYIAEAITLTGQAIIRTSANIINNYLGKILNDDKDRIVGVDTDSVVGDTLIRINDKMISIAEYYNSISDTQLVNASKDIKKVFDDTALSYDYKNKELVNGKVKYVMRHKTKKKLYKITTPAGNVIVTEDHSIIVLDEFENMLSIKPQELDKNKHRIINIVDTDSKVQLYGQISH